MWNDEGETGAENWLALKLVEWMGGGGAGREVGGTPGKGSLTEGGGLSRRGLSAVW